MAIAQHPLAASIVRILDDEGSIHGVGFLAAAGLICTCAHVVANATGAEQGGDMPPGTVVLVDFPFLKSRTLQAEVRCFVPEQPDHGGDIAVLRLLEDSPAGAQARYLHSLKNNAGEPFTVCGFPEDHNEGTWTSGEFSHHLTNGLVQLEGTKEPGSWIQRGFSGSPVWASRKQRIVGMVVATEMDRAAKVAYFAPSDTIQGRCPELLPIAQAFPRKLLGLMLAVILVLSGLLWVSIAGKRPESMSTPSAEANASASPANTTPLPSASSSAQLSPLPDSTIASLTPPVPVAIPTLPPVAPRIRTTIGVARFTNCPDVSSNLMRQLDELFPDQQPPVTVREEQTEIADSKTARARAKLIGTDLMIWGRCDGALLTDNFEILPMHGAPEAYEPPFLSIADPTKEIALPVAHALGLYLYRDYEAAAAGFERIAENEQLPDHVKVMFYLLQGNSLLFLGKERYDDAATAFQTAIDHQPNSAPAYHNLGVAQANIGWERAEMDTALATLSKTLELDATFLLAHVSQGQIWTMLGGRLSETNYFEQAESACNQALESPEPRIRALAEVCIIDIQTNRSVYNPELQPQLSETKLQDLAQPTWSAPFFSIAAAHHAVWSNKRNDTFSRQRALNRLQQYFKEASDDVHLERSKGDYEFAREVMLDELLSENRQ